MESDKSKMCRAGCRLESQGIAEAALWGRRLSGAEPPLLRADAFD